MEARRGSQSLGQPVWIGQRNKMTAGDLIRVKAESVFGDVPLEVGRKEPVIAANQHLERDVRPAARLTEWGADLVHGDLDDRGGLHAAAQAADGGVHLAFRHDAMQAGDLTGAAETDLAALRAIADALTGTDKPLVGTSGTGLLARASLGRAGTENDTLPGGYRVDAENFVIDLADKGIRSSVVRLPPITHSALDHHGFAPALIAFARQHGVSTYIGDGSNRWPAVHTLDAARLPCVRLFGVD